MENDLAPTNFLSGQNGRVDVETSAKLNWEKPALKTLNVYETRNGVLNTPSDGVQTFSS